MAFKKIGKRGFHKKNNYEVPNAQQANDMAQNNLVNIRKNEKIFNVNNKIRKMPMEKMIDTFRRNGGMYKEEKKSQFTDGSAKAYNKEFGKVVSAADVVIEVLDARDPMGSRCFPVEQSINRQGKKLILLINKADLIPRDNLQKWLKILKKEYPTLIFKASTQMQSSRLGRVSTKTKMLGENFSTSKCVGADSLLQLIRNIRLARDEMPIISVGVVGLPNVGKSSVINSLKRSRACCVGAVPGVTRHKQEVVLDSKIKLIDCPGLIFSTADSNDAMYALKNAINKDALEDPVTVAEAVLAKAGYDKMSAHYKIGELKDPSHFLFRLANRRGKIRKQGIADINAAAGIILSDWNSGKIKYYTEPPLDAGDVEITADEEADFDALSNPRSQQAICLDGPNAMDDDSELIPSNTKIIPNVPIETAVEPPIKKPRWETKRLNMDCSRVDIRKLRKKDLKKLNKERRRNIKNADSLTETMEAFCLKPDNDDSDEMIE